MLCHCNTAFFFKNVKLLLLTQTPNTVCQPVYTECLSGTHNIVWKQMMKDEIYQGECDALMFLHRLGYYKVSHTKSRALLISFGEKFINCNTFIDDKRRIIKLSFWRLNIPHGWCCDDSDEEDPAPAERVRRLEDEDVLEEECVQLRQLLRLGDEIRTNLRGLLCTCSLVWKKVCHVNKNKC